MPSATIRTATDADARRVAELDRATHDSTNSPGPPPNADTDPFAGGVARDHLLAVDPGGGVVGYVRVGHPTPLVASRHVVEVKGLAVTPSARRRGIGAALVDAAVAEARRRGARKVSLRVLATNPGARALYERAGFVQEGHLRDEFELDGELVDDHMLALMLDEQDGASPT